MSPNNRAQRNRVNRMAGWEGLTVHQALTRHPNLPEFGTYMVEDCWAHCIVASGSPKGYGLTLDQVEAYMIDRQAVRNHERKMLADIERQDAVDDLPALEELLKDL